MAPLTELPAKFPPTDASHHLITPPEIVAFKLVGLPQATVVGEAVTLVGANNPETEIVTETLIALTQVVVFQEIYKEPLFAYVAPLPFVFDKIVTREEL